MAHAVLGLGARGRVGVSDGSFVQNGVLYGPHYGPLGPRQFVFAVWNQAPVFYCYETNTFSQNLYARWKARGVNVIKHQHPSFPIGTANQDVVVAAVKAEGLLLLSAPRWNPDWGSRPDAKDYRDLAVNDLYWRTKWIGYTWLDEIDLYALPLSNHVDWGAGHALDGVNKPQSLTLTRRSAAPSLPVGTASTNWKPAFEAPRLSFIGQDSYEWHLIADDASAASARESPRYFMSTYNYYGIYNPSGLDPSLVGSNRIAKGRRFTAGIAAMPTHLKINGPLPPGRSADGINPPIYPPSLFDDTPGPKPGQVMEPQALAYAPGERAVFGYIATGRVDINLASYRRGGSWQPGRFLRNESWSIITHGGSGIFLFPQAVGSVRVTGYVDAVNNQFVVTVPPTLPSGFAPRIGGAMQVVPVGSFNVVGFIRRDNPQISGTTGQAGAYALDPALRTPIATGTAGSPVQFDVYTAAGPYGDDSNPENIAEFEAVVANVNRMQAHPTGGNLLINPRSGGRRAFAVERCPDTSVSADAYLEDMTQAPAQAGYTTGGVPILDEAGLGPQWSFGWPMGFEAFRVTGDDGAAYIYVRSLSNGNRPTFFPGYAALGLPTRVFGPFELVGFRRVGTGMAVEMTGTSGVVKAAVDDGPSTWFLIDSVAETKDEGNSGTTTFNVTIRRGGVLTGSNAVTATVSGTGVSPANPADFQGGVFPTQTLTFAAGEETKVFAVVVNGDTTAEQDETFAVTLSAPTNAAQIVASGKDRVVCTIRNDDAPLVGAFIWLVKDLTAAPALPGAPAGAVHLRAAETTNVTRDGITMRSRNSGQVAYDSGNFADTPGWIIANTFHGAEFSLPAGTWEVALIGASPSFGGGISGTLQLVDDPNGVATVRQTITFSETGALLASTDGTEYRTSSTAVGDAVNNLVWVAAAVTDLGGGSGLLRLAFNAGAASVAAIALRQT